MNNKRHELIRSFTHHCESSCSYMHHQPLICHFGKQGSFQIVYVCTHISCFTIPPICVNTVNFLENCPPPYTAALEGFNQLYFSHIEMEYAATQRNMTVQYSLFKQNICSHICNMNLFTADIESSFIDGEKNSFCQMEEPLIPS